MSNLTPDLLAQIDALLPPANDTIIPAVKRHRELLGSSLKEAVEFCRTRVLVMAGRPKPIRVTFAFDRFLRDGMEWTDREADFSMGGLHSGTAFRGTLEMDPDDLAGMKAALAAGVRPSFWVAEVEENG